MSSYFLEITNAERQELDDVIARWSTATNFSTPAERLMVTAMLPLLLQLKSVCTVTESPTSSPVDNWFDPELNQATDVVQQIDNRDFVPVSGIQDGSVQMFIEDIPDGITSVEQFDGDVLTPGLISPVGYIDPTAPLQVFESVVAPSTLVEL